MDEKQTLTKEERRRRQRRLEQARKQKQRPSPHFSSHWKMWRAIAVERRFFEWRLLADRHNGGAWAALVRPGSLGQRFATFRAQLRPFFVRRREPRSANARGRIVFLRFSPSLKPSRSGNRQSWRTVAGNWEVGHAWAATCKRLGVAAEVA